MKSALIPTTLLLAALAIPAKADVITDWNLKTGNLITESKMGTPPAIRVMAIVQTSAYGAVNAITQRYPAAASQSRAAKGASIDAAVAAAHRGALLKLLPAQQASIEAAYQAALASITDGDAKTAGIAIGEQAAAQVLAQRAVDSVNSPVAYRPHTSAGAYVPTAAPAVPQWSQRKPWLMTSAAQFRPAAPPALTSQVWVRDYNEVKGLGSKTSASRSAEQTEIALFWDYSLPSIYYGVVRSVADQPGREPTRNALLYAMAAQAMDDALIGVFDAKYHYNFWRPVTAIRNGDVDGHDGTQRDASWASLIDAPMHPEYPSGHAILASAVATVLKADIGAGPVPPLATTSPTAKGATRRWASLDDFVREVSDARIYGGIHFRTATEVGVEMGRRIGELAAKRLHTPGQ
ncbi:MAG: phosphatase PAP2 family protein [Reyranella sp.]|uniref:vanadium-dependent haloperoxidase n=1 Tax=Reyranella sp. TaxID=1929291 RepID=UPI00122585CF|nr:vanadium-dependent haloperoxidase [Reyranella sp.]TAJ36778.1 MAG: phosphatase PAP2 family protein [Reyranella sp.]